MDLPRLDRHASRITLTVHRSKEATCDDLPLLDSSDPKSWLLVIVVPEKDDFMIYRKLMQIRD